MKILSIFKKAALVLITLATFNFVFNFPVHAQEPSAVQKKYQEAITSFQSTIEIEQDTDLHIIETIDYQTSVPRHGIYRYLPVVNQSNQQKDYVEITNLSVHDLDGNKYRFEKSISNQNLIIKIGDPEKTFTGEKTYVLEYTTKNAVDHYETYDELYWDITGEGWQLPILQTKVEVLSPFAKLEEGQCYTGVFGSTAQDCQFTKKEPSSYEATTLGTLSSQENFTLVLKINPDNELRFPGTIDDLRKWFGHYGPVLLIVVPSLVMIWLWWSRGRDWVTNAPHILLNQEQYTQKRRAIWQRLQIPFVYEPFKDLTPAQVGAVANEKIEMREIVAEIIDLARKKYIDIERKTTKKLLGTNEDYTFTKKKKSASSLPEHQQYLLEKMFTDGSSIKLSTLKGTFYKYLPELKKKIWSSVLEHDYFEGNPNRIRNIYRAVSVVLAVVSGIYGIWLIDQIYFVAPWPLLLAGLSGAFMFWIAGQLPSKTKEGTSLMLQAKGLQKTIKRGAWREAIKEKHLFIEEVLPFAIGMGVAKQLAKDMEKIGEEPPEYVNGALAAGRGFDHFERSFVNSTSQSISYNPNSSSSSGSSGFSGGGFSGGGGGGGGGGSW